MSESKESQEPSAVGSNLSAGLGRRFHYRKVEPGDGTSVVMLGTTRISTDQIIHELNRIDDLERELIAWRERFSKFYFRSSDDCIERREP